MHTPLFYKTKDFRQKTYHLAMVITVLLFLLPLAVKGKEIALTFDDAPRPDSQLTGKQRTDMLLDALQKSGVEQVMFFVTTKHVTDKTQYQMQQYQAKGHLIANHSDQHLSLQRVSLEDYQKDLLKADGILKSWQNFVPLFRYPFLNEGREQGKVDSMNAFFKEMGYENGYVTVDNYDWYMDSLYQRAIKSDKQVDMEGLKKLYVETLWQAIAFYDAIAMEHLGRSPKHVLLLHDNDLAAYFIDDLVEHIKAQGWKIISPKEAYQDPIATIIPKTLFTGQGRVAALAKDKGAIARRLVHPAEDEQYLEQLFNERKVFKKKCRLQDAEILLGSWQSAAKDNLTLESWTKISDSTFEGLGQLQKNETEGPKTVETLRLVEMSGEVFYLAKVSHNKFPTAFKLDNCDQGLTFVNQQHDFPTQIQYQRDGDKLVADVTGENGKGFKINYIKKE